MHDTLDTASARAHARAAAEIKYLTRAEMAVRLGNSFDADMRSRIFAGESLRTADGTFAVAPAERVALTSRIHHMTREELLAHCARLRISPEARAQALRGEIGLAHEDGGWIYLEGCDPNTSLSTGPAAPPPPPPSADPSDLEAAGADKLIAEVARFRQLPPGKQVQELMLLDMAAAAKPAKPERPTDLMRATAADLRAHASKGPLVDLFASDLTSKEGQ